MTDVRPIEPLDATFDAEVTLPGSKSITNRALVCAALAEGTSVVRGLLLADDTEAMLEGVARLGAQVEVDRPGRSAHVDGFAGRLPTRPVELSARASGTTARFLLPVVANGEGTYVVRGDHSLSARPMDDGIALLRELGVAVESNGRLPVAVTGPIRSRSPLTVRGDVSSQFLSGVLLAAPTWPEGRQVIVDGPLVSRPYVEMTIEVMRRFGARVDELGGQRWSVEPTGYTGTDFAVEPDASAASYFFAAAAVTGGRVRVPGLGRSSLQGDMRFVDVLAHMGAKVRVEAAATTVEGTGTLHGVAVDLRDFSDMAPTLAVTAVFADGPTHITGIGFIRGKETDRIAALVRELGRLGVRADVEPDGLVVHPAPPHAATIRTYDDHRMAMSFAVIGLAVPGIEIADPGCVTKTFPDYFAVLESLRSWPG